MPTKVVSASEAAQIWVDGARARATRYGVNAPAAAQDWQTNATAAAANFKSAVSAGNIDKMFSGGIARAGAAKFQRKVAGVGKDRFAGGVSAAQSDYQNGVAPFLDTIKGITPPAKKVRGDPANRARSEIYQVELNKKRLALRGA